TVRVQESRYRVWPTYAAASSGNAASRIATRSRSRSPRNSAESPAAAAAARKERPRVVSPRSAWRMLSPPGVVRGALAVGRQREPMHQVGHDQVGRPPAQLSLGRL